ncbi:MAG: RNA polymerase factor sigma-32 [Rhodospirillales bacterium]|nr:RNA polymerase factor sigma-32 [Rhodospirillales bacterium]MDP6883353.1 RNA polymerase factor sigma-32 [Rhodospirillales bacterium]
MAGKAMERETSLSTTMVRAAARHPMLDNEEEKRLARHSAAGDNAAASRLIASHLRFVIKIARTYRNSGLPMSDLIQEGTVGLIQAVRRFNPDRGVRLSTYAMWWIRAAIQDHVVRSWSLVRIGTTNTQKAVFLRLRQIRAELISGAEDLSDEIVGKLAARLGTTAAEVAAVARRMAGGDQSLDQPLSGNADEGQTTLLDHLASEAPTPEETVAAASEISFISETIGKALAMLPPREEFIIRQRYFEEARQTFEAIGREIGLSKDRVRQLEARALEKLRDVLRPALAEQR